MQESIQNNNKQSTHKKQREKTAHIKYKHPNRITNTPYTKQQQTAHKASIIITIISTAQILKTPSKNMMGVGESIQNNKQSTLTETLHPAKKNQKIMAGPQSYRERLGHRTRLVPKATENS